MTATALPEGFRLQQLRREHPRGRFRCGKQKVDGWLATKALQHQEKRLSATKILLDQAGAIAGYYNLAIGQINFSALPVEMVKHLPRRLLPVALLAWLGVSESQQGRGLGRLLLARALRDCWEAGKTFAFVAVILDCTDAAAKTFYQHWSFQELPGHPYRLFLSAKRLEAMMEEP